MQSIEQSQRSPNFPPGEIIRDAREKKGWSQQEAATKAGCSISSLQYAERPIDARHGRSLIRLMTVYRICRALEIDESTARHEWERIRDQHASHSTPVTASRPSAKPATSRRNRRSAVTTG